LECVSRLARVQAPCPWPKSPRFPAWYRRIRCVRRAECRAGSCQTRAPQPRLAARTSRLFWLRWDRDEAATARTAGQSPAPLAATLGRCRSPADITERKFAEACRGGSNVHKAWPDFIRPFERKTKSGLWPYAAVRKASSASYSEL